MPPFIAYRAKDWQPIKCEVTADRVVVHFGAHMVGEVTRYALPQLHALNFVPKGMLHGGVTRSLTLDAHGKCLGSAVLEIVGAR